MSHDKSCFFLREISRFFYSFIIHVMTHDNAQHLCLAIIPLHYYAGIIDYAIIIVAPQDKPLLLTQTMHSQFHSWPSPLTVHTRSAELTTSILRLQFSYCTITGINRSMPPFRQARRKMCNIMLAPTSPFSSPNAKLFLARCGTSVSWPRANIVHAISETSQNGTGKSPTVWPLMSILKRYAIATRTV